MNCTIVKWCLPIIYNRNSIHVLCHFIFVCHINMVHIWNTVFEIEIFIQHVQMFSWKKIFEFCIWCNILLFTCNYFKTWVKSLYTLIKQTQHFERNKFKWMTIYYFSNIRPFTSSFRGKKHSMNLNKNLC